MSLKHLEPATWHSQPLICSTFLMWNGDHFILIYSCLVILQISVLTVCRTEISRQCNGEWHFVNIFSAVTWSNLKVKAFLVTPELTQYLKVLLVGKEEQSALLETVLLTTEPINNVTGSEFYCFIPHSSLIWLPHDHFPPDRHSKTNWNHQQMIAEKDVLVSNREKTAFVKKTWHRSDSYRSSSSRLHLSWTWVIFSFPSQEQQEMHSRTESIPMAANFCRN